jgi:ubiquinone/menaquinone biosynthesis C-methylase UbiE
MKEYQKSTIKTYNTHAAAFEKTRAPFINVEQIEKFLRKTPGKQILDVGCGPGRDARYFVDHGYTVTGVDLSAQLLALARTAVPEATFVEADMLSLPFEADCFDGVWANASLLHLSRKDIGTALQEIYRVLAPGGICYCSMKEGTGEHKEYDSRLNGGERFFSFVHEDEMHRYMKHAGFSIEASAVIEHDTMLRQIHWVQIFARKLV